MGHRLVEIIELISRKEPTQGYGRYWVCGKEALAIISPRGEKQRHGESCSSKGKLLHAIRVARDAGGGSQNIGFETHGVGYKGFRLQGSG